MGHVHIAYGEGFGDDLKYAYGDGTRWHIEVVDDVGIAGLYPSLDVFGGLWPHIGYQGCGHLRCAYVEPPTMALWGTLQDGELALTWTAFPRSHSYWVYGEVNHAYFPPGFAPGYEHRLAVLPTSVRTWSSASGIGAPDSNWTYLVLAVDVLETELCRSNRFGEQDFGTGTP